MVGSWPSERGGGAHESLMASLKKHQRLKIAREDHLSVDPLARRGESSEYMHPRTGGGSAGIAGLLSKE